MMSTNTDDLRIQNLRELVVPEAGLFVEDGQVPAWVGIEYMAQAIAAWAGCRARAAGKPPQLGFLLGSRPGSSFA